MPLRDVVLAALVPMLWGLGFALAKPAVGHFPPLLLLCFCYSGMGLLLGPRLRGRRTARWRIFIVAVLNGPLQGGLLFHGLQGLPASVAALLLQLQVPFSVLLAWPLLGEKPRATAMLGIAIAFAGVVLILGTPEVLPPAGAVAFVMGSAICWSLGQVLSRKWNRDPGPALGARIALYGLPVALAATLLLEDGHRAAIETASLQQWLGVLGVVLTGYVLSYVIWYSLLQRLRVDRLLPFILLMPPITVTIGVVAYGEEFGWATLIGALIVIGGVALVILRRAAAPLPTPLPGASQSP